VTTARTPSPVPRTSRSQLGPGTNFGLGGEPDEPLNASRMPWIRNVDLRMTRGLRMAGTDLTLFADFRNLFNFRNVEAIFSETGDLRNLQHRNRNVAPLIASLRQDAANLLATQNGEEGFDLSGSRCLSYAYSSTGGRGLPDCIMLRAMERNPAFGNGDQFLSLTEVNNAFNAWYDLNNGPQTLRGPGFNLRLGFELNF
jgi:hypothetical protein